MTCYQKNERQSIREYYEREGIVCVHDILDRPEVVRQTTKTLPLYPDRRQDTRETVCLPPQHELTKLMYGDASLQEIFNGMHDYRLTAPGDFPVEYREYTPNSANGVAMGWHKDLVMYEEPQVEMVYTVFNDDDHTRFQWQDSNGVTQTVRPRANDMVFVKANGPMHRVTGMGKNRRGIIKMIAHRSSPVSAMHVQNALCPMLLPTQRA